MTSNFRISNDKDAVFMEDKLEPMAPDVRMPAGPSDPVRATAGRNDKKWAA